MVLDSKVEEILPCQTAGELLVFDWKVDEEMLSCEEAEEFLFLVCACKVEGMLPFDVVDVLVLDSKVEEILPC